MARQASNGYGGSAGRRGPQPALGGVPACALAAWVPSCLAQSHGLALRVDPDEALVVARDLLRRVDPLEHPVEVALERVPPDRAADREAHVALDRRAGAQPAVDLLVVGPAAEDHAHDAVAVPGAGLLDDRLAVLLAVEALDLPNVGLDARVLDVGDRRPHELGPQLEVVAALLARDHLELSLLGGHEQLEQELAPALVEPVRQPREALDLAAVHDLVALGVEAHEHPREVW